MIEHRGDVRKIERERGVDRDQFRHFRPEQLVELSAGSEYALDGVPELIRTAGFERDRRVLIRAERKITLLLDFVEQHSLSPLAHGSTPRVYSIYFCGEDKITLGQA